MNKYLVIFLDPKGKETSEAIDSLDDAIKRFRELNAIGCTVSLMNTK